MGCRGYDVDDVLKVKEREDVVEKGHSPTFF